MKGNQPPVKPSKKKEPSAGKSEKARVDFLMRVVRQIFVKTYGEHETAALFDNDQHRETTTVDPAADAAAAPAEPAATE
jgi:hypothetical protein